MSLRGRVTWDAINSIIDCLEYNEHTGCYCDLHNTIFNTTYYVEGKKRAKEMLGDDVYEAIGRIYTWEKEQFGEIYTDLSDPVKIINMYHYIIGEELMYNCDKADEILYEHWDEEATEEVNQKLLEIFKEQKRILEVLAI